MGWLSRVLGRKPEPPRVGEALGVPIASIKPTPSARPTAVSLVFSPATGFLNDPVFLSRVQWRLQEMIYDGVAPVVPADAEARDRIREMKIGPDLPRVYLLSDTFVPTVRMYVADVAITPAVYEAGLDFNDHDCFLRIGYDLAASRPTAEVIHPPPTPTEIARARLDALLNRGAKFVWAELVQANYQLYSPGTVSAPRMVMFSFDYRVSPEEMRAWAELLYPLKFTNPSDPVLREAVWPLEADEQAWYYHRRFRMPEAFTGGREVFLADLWAHRPFMQDRFLYRHEVAGKPRRVPCLAEKKDTGWAGLELLPFGEADEYRKRAAKART
jgi:hypothetical protein